MAPLGGAKTKKRGPNCQQNKKDKRAAIPREEFWVPQTAQIKREGRKEPRIPIKGRKKRATEKGGIQVIKK